MMVTGEKVDEYVSAELIHCPGPVMFFQVTGETIQLSADRSGTVGEKTVDVEVGGYPNGDVFNVAVIVKLREGMIAEETTYFAAPFEAPEWRSQWVES